MYKQKRANSFPDIPGLHKALGARFGLQAQPPLQLKTVNVAELPQQGAIPI